MQLATWTFVCHHRSSDDPMAETNEEKARAYMHKLLATMREAPCIRVELPRAKRIDLLKREYAHFLADPTALAERLERLVPLHGKKPVERWADAAKAGDWDLVIAELLDLHYDPAYTRSIGRNFPRIADAVTVAPAAATDEAFRALARELATEDRQRVTA